MSTPAVPQSSRWQEQLQSHCQKVGLPVPVYHIITDRRGMLSAAQLPLQYLLAKARRPLVSTVQSGVPSPTFTFTLQVLFPLTAAASGGRTAWSCFVHLKVANVCSQYWFNDKNINNAKEAAAEAALKWLLNPSTPTTFYTGPGAPPTTRDYR
ncbi:hypothetical protein BDV59DRAFT_202844 [Aspergillus ambiguus]|uniref:uncharacterized protein n=1 Tax=Aspergillus ambiguus TaxID=176160 RepID=UPI003CCD93F9